MIQVVTAVRSDFVQGMFSKCVIGCTQFNVFFTWWGAECRVCDSIIAYPEQGKITCKGPALFSNLNDDFETFKRFGSDRSRLYRLTENLANLEEPRLQEAFTQYYRTHQRDTSQAQLVLHQFELHPGLKDLPKAGYRMDKLLWVSR